MRCFSVCCFLSVLLIACSPVKKESSDAQAVDRTLRVGTTAQVQTPFPFGDYYLSLFLRIANPPLMAMNQGGELVGLAATGYQVSEDFKTWTFTIREDLWWSDGQRFTARDAAFSLAYTGKHDPNAQWIGDTLERVETPDDKTLVMVFSRPYTNLNQEFTSRNLFPEHRWSGVTEPLSHGGASSYVGCGPFVLESVDIDQSLVIFTRNHYWKGEAPFFDKIEIRLYKSIDILALALERGEIDVFYNYAATYPYGYLEKLAENPLFDFEEKLNLGLIFLSFNMSKPPMNQREFREAVSWGIDYEELVRLDAMGYGTSPRRGFIPPSMGGFVETELLRYDPRRANTLLDEAGYAARNAEGYRIKDGKELRLTLLVRQDYGRVIELVREYLKNLGIALDLKLVDSLTWVSEKDRFNYDLTITRSTPAGMLMHAGYGSGYFDARRSGQGVLHNLEDGVFLNLCDRLLSTVDKPEILRLAGEMQNYYAKELPGIPLYWNTLVIPYRRSVSGFIANPLYGIFTIESLINARRN